MAITLRNYQDKAITDLDRAIESGLKRNIIVLPTGAGKTIIAGAYAKQKLELGQKTLFMVHRKSLVEQTAEKFDLFGLRSSFHASGYDYNLGADVDIGMIQTVRNRLDKFDFGRYDNVLVDEAHHSVSESYAMLLQRCLKANVTGLTATPERPDGRGLDDFYDNLIIGPTTQELIDAGALAPPKYFGLPMVADMKGVRIAGHDYNKEDLEERILNLEVVADAIKQYKKLIPNKKAVAFFPSIASAKYFAEEFSKAGIPAEYISGAMSPDEKKAVDKRFRDGEILVLCSVDVVSEGYDIPDCEAVLMLRPTKSEIIFLQQAGRALRKDDNNPFKIAYILDFVKNFSRFKLPTMNRNWSLSGRKKSKIKITEDGLFFDDDEELYKRCWHCFVMMEQIVDGKCPDCGMFQPVKPKKKTNDDEDVNTEHGDFDLVHIRENLTDEEYRAKINNCRTLKEFQQLGELLGYKPGWAYLQYKQRVRKKYTNKDT